MDNINDVAASSTLGSASTKRSAENQSQGTLNQGNVEASGESDHQTMSFSQSVDPLTSDIQSTLDDTFNDGGLDTEAGLGEFLSRPVQLDLGGTFKALAWTVGAGIVGSSLAVIDPWTLWQANTKVRQKLSNFAYLKGELKVRFVVAGTPFHYGRILVSYVPFAGSNQILSQLITHCGAVVEGPLMYLSTMMSGEIDPMSSTPLEMTLPFVSAKNWIDVTASETLGTLYLREFVPLTRASDTAVSTLAITAFAWMEKVELCVPTLTVPTMKREQPKQASISGVASAVACAAGELSRVPVLGPLAKATSIASQGVADVAKLFGMSRPVDIEKPDQVKFITESSMSFTQGASLAQKLTLDPQQEVTIDPRTLGLPANDEMTFESIVNRECWLTTVTWTDTGGPFTVSAGSPAAVIGALLFVSNVTPNLCKRVTTVSSGGTWQIATPTPSMLVARAFNFWRGTMVYRFRVIASSFHRGNLKITYDPLSRDQSVDTNSQMTHVIDISEGRELIVRVPWCSQYPYLEVANQKHEPLENYSPSIQTAYTNFAYVNFNKSYHNGVLMATIVNALVAPNSQPAYLAVSSWMEDCEFQSPSNRMAADFPILTTPTSGKITNEIMIVAGKQSKSMSQICFGEQIRSVRALLKRATLQYQLIAVDSAATSVSWVNFFLLPAFPLTGYANLAAISQACRVSYITYFSNAFLARRGGVRYTVYWEDGNVSAATSNFQHHGMANYYRSWDAVSPGTTGSVNMAYTLDQIVQTQDTAGRAGSGGLSVHTLTGYEGMYIANTLTQEIIHEVEIPSYGGTRFALCQYCPVITTVSSSQFTLTKNPVEAGFQVWGGNYRRYASKSHAPTIYSASAEDLSFYWFQAAPPLYITPGT